MDTAAPVTGPGAPVGDAPRAARPVSARSDRRHPAGKVTIDFATQSPVPGDVAVAEGAKQLGVTPVFGRGGTRTLTLTLARGTYTFFCTVDSHRQAGMSGTLTVS